MNNIRQHARQKICKIIDEMVADLHKIKRHALHFDEISVVAIGRGLASRFNRLSEIYRKLNNVSLPPEKKIITPDTLKLH